MVLHFSNTATTTSPQTHSIHANTGAQSFQFAVPPATYSKMYLAITSSEGNAALTITLNYAAGAPPTTLSTQVPDYGVGGASANDMKYFNLIQGMCKWTTDDTEVDGPSHTLTAIELTPTPTATLTSIQVAKTGGTYVVFWGATGIATSAVTVGPAAPAGRQPTRASTGRRCSGGAGGAAGASGTGGNGAAGTSGAGGGGGEAGPPEPAARQPAGPRGPPRPGAQARAGEHGRRGGDDRILGRRRLIDVGLALGRVRPRAAHASDAAGWTALVVGLALLLRTGTRRRR